MKICFFDDNRLGVVIGDKVHDVTSVLAQLPACRPPFPRHDIIIEALPGLLPALQAAADQTPGKPIDAVQFRAPVMNPGKVVAAPINYLAHMEETMADPVTFSQAQVTRIQETGMFLKATSSIIGPAEGIRLRLPERRNDHEVELVAVIGKAGSDITLERALDHVFGYTIGLDITVRGKEERSFRKSVDSYTVLGPWLVTADEFGDPSDVALSLAVNGAPRQNARTSAMVLSLRELIVFASRFYTLHPGDVLMTGTPEGVGPLVPGDMITATIDHIGTLTVRVS